MTHTLHTHTDVLQPASAAAHHSFGSTQPYRVGFVGFFRPFLFSLYGFFFFFLFYTQFSLLSLIQHFRHHDLTDLGSSTQMDTFLSAAVCALEAPGANTHKMTEPISARTAAFRKQTPSTPLPSYRSQLSNRLHPSSETLRNISKILSADTKQQNMLQSCMAPGT